ncbi:MAG: efflux RND transporter periplasmic adaptor subunit, partial [Rhodobacter sp.]|nr:efflux RND transporter periplasmic adaptor subunit [Rhodobacter sp.]
ELERAQRDVEGDRALFAKGYVSRQRLQDRERALAVARAAYEATAFDERSAQIYAPATSVVLEKKAEVGEVVQAGQAVVRIADTSSAVVLRAFLPSRDVERVRVGDRAWVHLGRSQAEPVTGIVTGLGQQSDSLTGAVLVEIQLNPRAPATRSGEIVHAEIEARVAPSSKSGFVSVPAEALVEVNGDKALIMLVTDGGMAKTASVQFVGLDGDNVLLAGLPAGSRVIIAGAGLVADGQQVKVVSLQRREGAQLASLR